MSPADKERLHQRLWSKVVALSVLLGIATGLLTVLSKLVRHAIRDGAQWFYPLGVIAVLVAVLLASIAAHIWSSRRGVPSQVSHPDADLVTYQELVAIVTRNEIDFLCEPSGGQHADRSQEPIAHTG